MPIFDGTEKETSSVGDSPCNLSWTFEKTGTLNNGWIRQESHHVEFRVDASIECGGSNEEPQYGQALAQVTVQPGEQMEFEWDFKVTSETDLPDVDRGWWELNGLTQQRFFSVGSGGGCATITQEAQGNTVLTEGEHTIAVRFQTVDGSYHNSDVGVEFIITSCQLFG